MPILQPESRAVGTLTLLRLGCPGSGLDLAGSERGRDQRVILSSGGTTAMGAWEEEQRWGGGESVFGAAESEEPRTGKWRQPDTVVRRAGEQVRLKYSLLLEGMSDS